MTLRGKYHLDRVIGRGGMAAVYAATHRNRKRFAVKMLHVELSIHAEVRERFLREGYVANTVDHPGALAVLDDDVAEDNSAFLVMELLEGTTVDDMIGEGRLETRTVLTLARQLLSVLEAAHAKGIIHRDIKPANLFVVGGSTLKVLDFGIARLRDATAAGVTATGAMMGTPTFMPPEQVMAVSSEIDHKTDLWAVGATMFTMATGRTVHEGESAPAVLVKAATQPAPRLLDVLPSAPPALAAIVDRALSFDKSARYADAREMGAAIDAAYLSLFGAPIGQPEYGSRPRLGTDPEIAARASGTSPGSDVRAMQTIRDALPKPPAAPAAAPAAPAAPAPIVSTTGAVSTSPRPMSPSSSGGVPGVWIGVAIALVAVVGGGLAVRAGMQRSHEASPAAAGLVVEPASAPATAAAAEPSVASPIATTTASAASATSAASAIDPPPVTGSPPSSAATTAPAVTATARGSKPAVAAASINTAPATTPAAKASSATPARPAPSAPPSARPGGANCDPPYVLDANGKRTYKKECL